MGIGERRTAKKIHTVEDARHITRRRVPRVVFDYIDGAADGERTANDNEAALAAIEFVPKMAVTQGVPGPDLSVTVLGQRISMPVLVGPVGFTRVMDPKGDVAGARAAGAAGTIFTLSSMSGHAMGEVHGAYEEGRATAPGGGVEGGAWFQLYALGGREGSEQILGRAQDAGFSTLVLTVDTQMPGNRERDAQHRVSIPLRLDPKTALRFAPRVLRRPRWLADAARDRFRFDIVNAMGLEVGGRAVTVDEALVHWVLSPLTWTDFDWIREQWKGPIVAKGLLSGEDARIALDRGATAVAVSNHGGRQLDGVSATMPALVEVLGAVGDRSEVLVDGGIRRGSDVVRAVALGARSVLIGRAWAFALGAAGETGVREILSMFRNEISRTLRLLGAPSVSALDRTAVRFPEKWEY